MFEAKKRINLSLPTSYNRCSVEQLRKIASVMVELAAVATPLRPFNIDDVKTAAFFKLANLEIVSEINPRVPVEEQYYMVRFQCGRLKRWWNWLTGNNRPFALYLWQVCSWICKSKNPHTGKEKKGMLDWMDADNKDFFVIFPFELLKCRKGLLGWPKKFKGPNPMLDDFSWQRYRFAQDYMSNYIQQQNTLLRLQKMGKKVSANDMLKAVHHLDTAKALFLANLFEAKIRFTDEYTGQVRTDWHYQSNQASDNLEYFRNFPDADWQIILLWWSGIMGWLGKTYPRVIKVQPTKEKKGQKSVNPLEVYARTTATMEKYVGLTADEVEREPYTTILQQMEDIARSNEDIEKMKSKRKRK